MIPIRDTNPRRTFPYVNIVLIVVNIAVFLWEVSLGTRVNAALASIAFIPARFWEPGQLAPDTMSMFVSMFLHGGWLHLGGNMLYLWIFGDNVEDRLGHVKYLIFYFACGIAATFAHAFMNPQSALPAVGASGAIAGVLGGYLVLFPHARVMTFIPIGFVVALRELPAILVLGLWFVLQIFTGAASLGARSLEEAGGVAYFAHIGGFIAGLILILLMAKRTKPREAQTWMQP